MKSVKKSFTLFKGIRVDFIMEVPCKWQKGEPLAQRCRKCLPAWVCGLGESLDLGFGIKERRQCLVLICEEQRGWVRLVERERHRRWDAEKQQGGRLEWREDRWKKTSVREGKKREKEKEGGRGTGRGKSHSCLDDAQESLGKGQTGENGAAEAPGCQ